MTESRILPLLEKILNVPTAPFYEHLVAAAIQKELKNAASLRRDRRGNFIAHVGRQAPSKPFAFCAHMDHPGLIVQESAGDLLDAIFLGGVPEAFFRRGAAFDLFGTTDGAWEGRALVETTWGKWPERKEVRLRRVQGRCEPGQFGMWALPAFQKKGGKIHSRACDDLIGCAAVVLALRECARLRLPATGVFTRREEIGLNGAREIARSGLIPKKTSMISIETSSERNNALQGDGPIVRVGDRSSIFSPALTGELCKIAAHLAGKDPKFQWQRKLMDGGTCEATAFEECNYQAGGLCIALGNYHNCGPGETIRPENVDLRDFQGIVRLMVEVARQRQ